MEEIMQNKNLSASEALAKLKEGNQRYLTAVRTRPLRRSGRSVT